MEDSIQYDLRALLAPHHAVQVDECSISLPSLCRLDFQGPGVVVYIDDILIYSATCAEHVSLVRKVLGQLL